MSLIGLITCIFYIQMTQRCGNVIKTIRHTEDNVFNMVLAIYCVYPPNVSSNLDNVIFSIGSMIRRDILGPSEISDVFRLGRIGGYVFNTGGIDGNVVVTTKRVRYLLENRFKLMEKDKYTWDDEALIMASHIKTHHSDYTKKGRVSFENYFMDFDTESTRVKVAKGWALLEGQMYHLVKNHGAIMAYVNAVYDSCFPWFYNNKLNIGYCGAVSEYVSDNKNNYKLHKCFIRDGYPDLPFKDEEWYQHLEKPVVTDEIKKEVKSLLQTRKC